MYNINQANIAKNLKKYRNSRGYSLDYIGKIIKKTKATVSKYENNEIIPDIITLLEICNPLNISLSELIPPDYENTSISNNLSNPFCNSILFMYYFTGNKLITSILELYQESNSINIKLYNAIKNNKSYAKDYSYYYEGTLEYDGNVAFINLSNANSKRIKIEKIQISVIIPWSKNIPACNCFISALTPNSIPVIKKGIISTKFIDDLKAYETDLRLSDSELSKIKLNNSWVLETIDYDHFNLDFEIN
jgi:transcriptional regulator with XRE-family HTH domain